jgi:hypothetical protein
MAGRTLSALLRRQLFSPFRDEDVRILLTIDHSTFNDPFRFVSGDPNEFETLTSNGEEFQTFPFEITLLSDDDNPPEAFIRIQNVDDRIGSTVLALPDDALTVMIQMIMRTTPDVIEYEASNLELVDVEITAVAVTGRLFIRGLSSEPCPGRRLTNKISPVIFR